MQDARNKVDASIIGFDNDLRALKTASDASHMLFSSQSPTHTSTAMSSMPESLNALETHAQEMASLLDSLVSHFDMCVNAIRHTEGGFAAVRKAASSLPPGAEPVSVSMYDAESPALNEEPLSEEERAQMQHVLENDAAQVDDVIAELLDHLNEMERNHAINIAQASAISEEYSSTSAAFTILENISVHLPAYIMSSSDFRIHWEETKEKIREQLEDLESMRVFYENYHASYDAMILEVHRRRNSEDKVKAIIRKAMEQIEEESQLDMKERVAFKADVGDFIPQDLWTGVDAGVPRWEFVQTDGGVRNETPSLEREVVDAAKRREKQKKRLS